MLPSSPIFPHKHLQGNEALRGYFLRLGGGTPVAILAYLDDFLVAGHDPNVEALWGQQTQRVFDAMGFSFKEKECQWDLEQEKRHLGVIINTKGALFLIP